MDDRRFTLPELAALVGVEYRTLHTWVRRGVLAGSLEQAKGSGTRNLFDRDDAVDTYVLADLRRAGLPLTRLIVVAAELRRSRRNPGAGAAVLLINGAVQLAGYDDVARVVSRASPTLVYDLSHAAAGLDRALAEQNE
jgi:DNA-binding transcriptional MerR regulator